MRNLKDKQCECCCHYDYNSHQEDFHMHLHRDCVHCNKEVKALTNYEKLKEFLVERFVTENFTKFSKKEQEELALKIQALVIDMSEHMRDQLHKDRDCPCRICKHLRWAEQF